MDLESIYLINVVYENVLLKPKAMQSLNKLVVTFYVILGFELKKIISVINTSKQKIKLIMF